MKTARDAMSPDVITVTPTLPLGEVARTLNENGISGCPVVDITGVMRGVISRTNLLDYAQRQDPEAMHSVMRLLIPGSDDDEAFPEGLDDGPEAQDVMETDVISVTPEMGIDAIARLMSRERIHRVPVLEDGRVIGIITSLDLLGEFPTSAAASAAS